MSLAKPTDFLLNTDYEMDKIVYFKEMSVKITDGNTQTVTFSPGLNFAPLCFGLWSKTSDFSQPRRMTGWGHGIYDATSQSYVSDFARLFSTEWNGTPTIEIELAHMTVGSTIYIRIYGFEPDYSHASIGATSGNSSTFILNTDYNYRKLLKKGRVNVPHKNDDPQVGLYDPVTIPHKLGYKPQIMLWIESIQLDENYQETSNRTIEYFGYGCLHDQLNQNTLAGAIIDDQNITFYVPGGQQVAENWYVNYRIYYDKAE